MRRRILLFLTLFFYFFHNDHFLRFATQLHKFKVTNKQTTFMEKQLSKGPIEANAYVHSQGLRPRHNVQFGLYYYINYIDVPYFVLYYLKLVRCRFVTCGKG